MSTGHLPSDNALPDDWYIRFYPDLYRHALRLTRNEDKARDLVADTIARAHQELGCLRAAPNWRAWLFRVQRNCFVDGWRREKRRQEVERKRAWKTDGGLEPSSLDAPSWEIEADPEHWLLNLLL